MIVGVPHGVVPHVLLVALLVGVDFPSPPSHHSQGDDHESLLAKEPRTRCEREHSTHDDFKLLRLLGLTEASGQHCLTRAAGGPCKDARTVSSNPHSADRAGVIGRASLNNRPNRLGVITAAFRTLDCHERSPCQLAARFTTMLLAVVD